MSYFNFNGKLLPSASAVIGPDNRGLRYGDGLFETFKSRNNELVLVDEHLARLWNGLRLLQFEIPKFFTPDRLQQEISSLLIKNKHPNARIRLSVFRGDGGLYDHNNSLQYIIQSWPLAASTGLNQNGLQLGIFRDARKSVDAFSNCKHNNFLPYTMGALFAKNKKYNDSIVLNQHGHICDTTIANIFIIKDDVISTPSLQEGCIAGIMRKTIIQCLEKNEMIVNENILTEEMLLQADEVFLTNSISNMRWVGSIENKSYARRATTDIYNLLTKTLPDIFC